MKKLLALTLAALMALALTACGAAEEPAEEEQEPAYAGMANPWSDVETPQEAAEGAGVGSFQVPESGTETTAGALEWSAFRCMEGIAEADGTLGEADLTVRKGLSQDDISGDYREYAAAWTQDVGCLEVLCSGPEEGRASKVTWTDGEYSYSIGLRDLEDLDADCWMDEDAVETLVSAIR